jgi:hypothetical protein
VFLILTTQDGTINEVGGSKYAGLDRFAAREAVWKDMENEGATIKVKKLRKPRGGGGRKGGDARKCSTPPRCQQTNEHMTENEHNEPPGLTNSLLSFSAVLVTCLLAFFLASASSSAFQGGAPPAAGAEVAAGRRSDRTDALHAVVLENAGNVFGGS